MHIYFISNLTYRCYYTAIKANLETVSRVLINEFSSVFDLKYEIPSFSGESRSLEFPEQSLIDYLDYI